MPKNQLQPKTTVTYEQIVQSLYEIQQIVKEIGEEHKKTEQVVKEIGEENKKIQQVVKEIGEERKKTEQVVKEIGEEHKKTEQSIKELSEEHNKTEQSIKELSEERKKTDLELKKIDIELKQTDIELKQNLKQLSKQMGELGNRFGELGEQMILPGIVSKFNELGYHFSLEFQGNLKIRDKDRVLAEIDILLENGSTIAVVEVKTCPVSKDIDDLIKRIEIFRDNRKKRNFEHKKIIGAIAGAIFRKNVRKETIDAGFYVFAQSGDTIKLDIPQNFKPKEF
ncbi:MAG: hypothetical protein LBU34_06040 [Planctomycetaceae bacterium]|nr:hypothetical protein [Planctomycetaceae bacterium]